MISYRLHKLSSSCKPSIVSNYSTISFLIMGNSKIHVLAAKEMIIISLWLPQILRKSLENI